MSTATDLPESEALYDHLRTSLLQRVHDKEPQVRTQAVVALCQIVPIEDDAENRQDVLDAILNALSRDPVSYVVDY